MLVNEFLLNDHSVFSCKHLGDFIFGLQKSYNFWTVSFFRHFFFSNDKIWSVFQYYWNNIVIEPNHDKLFMTCSMSVQIKTRFLMFSTLCFMKCDQMPNSKDSKARVSSLFIENVSPKSYPNWAHAQMVLSSVHCFLT